ncbi:hypothetical protein EVAR_17692_1 [Eumeta japonica]|uniref:Uncharacterized protein n=1 Tax=Eumeta variegata TaxID=151549 RepID=A0A4C1UTK4_EUMVA|nr:hypothetical protein EVAR_17692_1 [Eumeta japonica]
MTSVSGGGAAPALREFSNPSAFPRNVPSRSTFHSGQTRSRGASAGGGGAYGDGGSPHQARPSFFSKISSRFSKRKKNEKKKIRGKKRTETKHEALRGDDDGTGLYPDTFRTLIEVSRIGRRLNQNP